MTTFPPTPDDPAVAYGDTSAATLAARSQYMFNLGLAIKTLQTYVLAALPSATGGWSTLTQTPTYTSADAPTFTITVAGVDLTGQISVGMRIRLSQTTTKYFIVTAIAFSANTVITLYGGTDYVLANAAITATAYSGLKAPQGFPTSPAKWTVSTAVHIKSVAPVNGDVTHFIDNAAPGTNPVTISVPIGAWTVSLQTSVLIGATKAAGGLIEVLAQIGLSATILDLDDDRLTAGEIGVHATGLALVTNLTAPTLVRVQRNLIVAVKTLYYANYILAAGPAADSLAMAGTAYNSLDTFLDAVCAYL